MYRIIDNRSSGKTSRLMLLAKETGSIIACMNPSAMRQKAYAYGITCHKAQGSEWDKVLVFEERFPFSEEEHMRWLYTAITRAKEKLVIVRS